jgi:pyrroline-5-carboxylate reductase
VVRAADVLILAVKPQQMSGVLRELSPVARLQQLFISIAAGIPCRAIELALPRVPVIRVMPNLPATVGQGFAAYALGRHARARHRAIAQGIFEAAGAAVCVPERLLDAVTAVSGSGPAYVFFVAEAWMEAARQLGLPAAVAEQAVRQTLRGSLELLEAHRLSPSEWIGKVASKKGTTEAALTVLARRRVRAHLIEAIGAAARRSRQLSQP